MKKSWHPFLLGLLSGVVLTVVGILFIPFASSYHMIESSFILEEQDHRESRLILRGKSEEAPAIILTRNLVDQSLKRCSVVDRNGDWINLLFKQGVFSMLEIDKVGSHKLLATDYGADGVYDLRIDAQNADVLKDGVMLKGHTREGGGVVVESEGVSYRLKADDEAGELIFIKAD